MMFLSFLVVLYLPFTRGESTSHTVRPTDTLSWGHCEDYGSPFECAPFQVPLNYADTAQGTTTLALIRLRALTSPRKGYMFYNPGGPGASGLELLGDLGTKLQAQIGSGWDVLSWDPRGVGRSGPNITLFDTYQEYDEFWDQLQGTGKFEAHGNLTQRSDADFFRAQATAFDGFLQNFDAKYVGRSGNNLKYVGSCAAVRDLVRMVDAIYGPGEDVNYYGFSYGTLIGAYLTQMFPDRIGKVILDGVLDAYSYTNGIPMAGLPTDVQDVESGLRGWSSACAGSTKCILSTLGNGTADGVMRIIDGVLNTAHATYDGTVWSQMGLVVNGTIPSDIHAWPFDVIARIIYQYIYSASSWPQLDKGIVGLYTLQKNSSSTALTTRSPSHSSPFQISPIINSHWLVTGQWGSPNNAWSQVVYAIGCGDAQRTPSNYTTSDVFEQIINVSQNVSQHFGTIISPRWFCHRWATRAVERLGDFIGATPSFTRKPKNVVLVIGNTADPITPFSSAKRLASVERLGEMARLVEFKAIGHSSLSNNSTCISRVIRSYVEGCPPQDKGDDGPDVTCEVDSTPFSEFYSTGYEIPVAIMPLRLDSKPRTT